MSEIETVLHMHSKICPATAAEKTLGLEKEWVHCSQTTTIRKAQMRAQKATVACVAVYKESNENVKA
jgi:hypothetical protein